MKLNYFKLTLILLAFLLAFQDSVNAQIFKSLENKIKRKTEETINKEIDKKINKKSDTKDTQENSKNPEVKNNGNQSLKVYTQYDFVPGDQVLFYDDFSKDAIGDFPALWTGTGSGELNQIEGIEGNWFKLTDRTVYYLMKDLTLPINFILEFDLVYDFKTNNNVQLDFDLFEGKGDWVKNNNFWFGISGYGNKGVQLKIDNFQGNFIAKGYYDKNWTPEIQASYKLEEKKSNHIIIWRQNRRLRIYTDGKKILDGPTALPADFNPNRLAFFATIPGQNSGSGLWVSNFKFTTASPDTRHKLLTEGKFVSYGIYFDSGKSIVKAESYGTLKEIAKILNENPDLKIKIIGHTDADGDEKSNLSLSQARATAVKDALVKDFKIDEQRVETDGLGESKPVSTNDTPENKAKNRRVEFIKL